MLATARVEVVSFKGVKTTLTQTNHGNGKDGRLGQGNAVLSRNWQSTITASQSESFTRTVHGDRSGTHRWSTRESSGAAHGRSAALLTEAGTSHRAAGTLYIDKAASCRPFDRWAGLESQPASEYGAADTWSPRASATTERSHLPKWPAPKKLS